VSSTRSARISDEWWPCVAWRTRATCRATSCVGCPCRPLPGS